MMQGSQICFVEFASKPFLFISHKLLFIINKTLAMTHILKSIERQHTP